MNKTRWVLRFVLLLSASTATAVAASPLPLSNIKLPPGFEISLFATVPNARQMALGKNTLFVGSREAGDSERGQGKERQQPAQQGGMHGLHPNHGHVSRKALVSSGRENQKVVELSPIQ